MPIAKAAARPRPATRGTIEFVYSDARPNLYLGYVRVHRLIEDDWRAISHRSFYVVDRGS